MFRLVCFLSFVLCAIATAVGAALPRYQFKVGQELRYDEVERTQSGKNLPHEAKVVIRLFVVGANDDGSHELLFSVEGNADKYLCRATVTPDGQMAWNRSMEPLFNGPTVRMILPRLPSEKEFADLRWTEAEALRGARWDYSAEPSAGALTISANWLRPSETMANGSLQCTWSFDLAKGLISGWTIKGHWEEGDQHEDDTATLTEIVEHDAETIQTLREDAARYFDLVQEHTTRFKSHDYAKRVRAANAVGVDAWIQARHDMLAAAAGTFKHPLVQDQYRRLTDKNDKGAKGLKEDLEHFGKTIDQPSPEWSTTDLDGQPHTLADYRGKVVVLDFWYRRCGFCTNAHPQVQEVAKQFKDKPVAFLAVNTDKEIEDARFAVAKLPTPYPTLLGREMQQQYNLTSCPTWVVLDGQGTVRAIHVGCRATVQEELAETIAALLTQ